MKVWNRSLVLVVAALAVLAVGCGSSKSNDQASSTTEAAETGPTLPYGIESTTSTAASSDTTPPPFTDDPDPIVRAPDPDAFCIAFGDVQDLGNTFGDLTLDNGLGLASAPAQARAAARKMRETVPDLIQPSTDEYATIVDQAGQAIARATSLRRLSDAVFSMTNARANPDLTPTYDWVVRNCTSASYSQDPTDGQ